MRKTVRRPDTEWKELIEQFQKSGMTAYRWCAEEGISAATFRRKLNIFLKNDETAENENISENTLEKLPIEEITSAEYISAGDDREDNKDNEGDIIAENSHSAEMTETTVSSETDVSEDCIKIDVIPELGKISRKCRTVYLADTENVGGEAIASLVKSVDASAKLLLFHTDYSKHISYGVLGLLFEKWDQISLIPCSCGTGNALDFQLVSVLGSLICAWQRSTANSEIPEFVIFSNDHGFDAAVRFWMLHGIRARRLTPDEILKLDRKEKTAEPETDSKNLTGNDEIRQNDTEEGLAKTNEDEISRYYISHPEYQQSMKNFLSARVGAEFKKRQIKLSKKPPVMDILMKNPAPKEEDFDGVCTVEKARMLLQVPAEFIKMQREETYKQELKRH